ncbi:hypothetical protein GH808_09220 [Acetobacterium fimetarium]|uniref:Uncharacterized protein n=1 Tax=Acetobacterium fimetarium TaxID=52691 RepID=A0ABR6WW76_9FIRM|nr:hypothetical protein [Acetobacterium fimetarium]MBC3804610.1 hypothetical protein [Acetobacterium fimetarium]
MNSIKTKKYGPLTGVTFSETYKNGILKGCAFNQANHIKTPLGTLIPNHGESTLRNREGLSLEFFRSGQIKSIDLAAATGVATSLGLLSAERISFYESGSIHRLFPLNGRINGYWTENDEYTLAEPIAFDLLVGDFTAKIVSLCFYESGALKSLTLWPQEIIEIKSPDGLIKVRYGFSLYENGNLKSFEPALPEPVDTPVGIILAYDCNAHGINCDQNSVTYGQDGTISSLLTSNSGLMVTTSGSTQLVQPVMKPGKIDPEVMIPEPMTVLFHKNALEIVQDTVIAVDLLTSQVRSVLVHDPLKKACGNCSECSHCG